MSWLANRYLRIDPRSLGLFRILFGLTLIGDLLVRWSWLPAFYTNDGVLPNHNNLFQVRDMGGVWSIYHSFSSADEVRVAFAFTLIFYLFFTLGWHARVFSVVSAVCFVSLSGRNALLGGIGESYAISLLLFGVFLPLGARYSLDSLRSSFVDVDERSAADLNDRARPKARPVPASLAALAILVVACGVPLCGALQQNGASWRSGDALYYALHTDRWTSAFGAWLAGHAPVAGLAAWTKLIKVCELSALPLALVPGARRLVRPFAMAALGLLGLTFALCFSLGPYGWSLLCAVALLIPEESWEARKRRNRPVRLVYDDDCGICLLLARLLKRLDTGENVAFVPSSGDKPAGVSVEMAERSMISVDARGRAHEDAAALAHVLRSLPLAGFGLGYLISLPGLNTLCRKLYRKVADNRMRISEACGLGACGLAAAPPKPAAPAADPESAPPPVARIRRALAVAVQSALVLATIAMIAARSDANGVLPLSLHLANHPRIDGKLLYAASYARITAPWDLWAPDPPMRNEALVVEAATRDGTQIDVLSGFPPDLALREPKRHHLGALWAEYTDAVHRDEYASFRSEFRRYLMRGGAVADETEKPLPLNRLKVYWVSAPIAAPGTVAEGEVKENELYDYAPQVRLPDFSAPPRSPVRLSPERLRPPR